MARRDRVVRERYIKKNWTLSPVTVRIGLVGVADCRRKIREMEARNG